MITDDIRKFLEARPFDAFFIIMSSGMRYEVASPDHADINPLGNQMVVWFDDGSGVTISLVHVTAVEKPVAQAA